MTHSPPHDAFRRSGYGRAPVAGDSTHVVQFYESERFLVATVGDFLVEGLTGGQPVVVIATADHSEAFLAHLRSRNVHADRARRSGQLVMLDAHETLAGFMSGDHPDPARFRENIGRVLERARRDRPYVAMRAYGEMVDVLVRQGNIEGAVELEALWNELAESYAFTLLCAYAMDGFATGAHGAAFETVCRQHMHVVPTERFVQASGADRHTEIAILQQRARALETELEHRKALEHSLRDALSSAEEANRAKSEFLAVMSHELRTPLNAIGGHVQLVELGLHGPVTEAQREALERVQRSQRYLLTMINDLLNLTRVETGAVEYEIRALPLGAVVREIAGTLTPLFELRGVDCDVLPGDGETTALADRDRLRQIVVNLLTNAIKFTPQGGRVTVSTFRDGGHAIVRVADTGCGIPTDRLEKIFEPFVQLGARGPGQQDGVGLGLSISRALARGMDGELEVESRLGEGSTFTVRLPLETPAA